MAIPAQRIILKHLEGDHVQTFQGKRYFTNRLLPMRMMSPSIMPGVPVRIGLVGLEFGQFDAGLQCPASEGVSRPIAGNCASIIVVELKGIPK